MAKRMFDDQRVTLTCPQRGEKMRKSVRWLRDHPTFRCTGCDATFQTKELARALNNAEDKIADFVRQIGKPRR